MTGKPSNSPPLPRKHVPGEPGIWVFIFGDMFLFVVYFSNYLTTRTGQVDLFRESQKALDQNYGAINTFVLLLSSLFVLIGQRAIRRQDTVLAPRMFVGAIICGLTFMALKAGEWGSKVAHGITPATDSFFQMYFILTGLHLVHVVLGLIVLNYIRSKSRQKDISPGAFIVIEGGCCWWHMVDMIWMILFPLVYLAN